MLIVITGKRLEHPRLGLSWDRSHLIQTETQLFPSLATTNHPSGLVDLITYSYQKEQNLSLWKLLPYQLWLSSFVYCSTINTILLSLPLALEDVPQNMCCIPSAEENIILKCRRKYQFTHLLWHFWPQWYFLYNISEGTFLRVDFLR